MSTNVLCGLEPQSVFSYFEQLTRIPRGSGNEKAVSDYIIAYAEQHGYRWERDEANNVKLYAPATSGYDYAQVDALCGRTIRDTHCIHKDSRIYTVLQHGKSSCRLS